MLGIYGQRWEVKETEEEWNSSHPLEDKRKGFPEILENKVSTTTEKEVKMTLNQSVQTSSDSRCMEDISLGQKASNHGCAIED